VNQSTPTLSVTSPQSAACPVRLTDSAMTSATRRTKARNAAAGLERQQQATTTATSRAARIWPRWACHHDPRDAATLAVSDAPLIAWVRTSSSAPVAEQEHDQALMTRGGDGPRGVEIGRGRSPEQQLEHEASDRGGEAQQDESADERGDHLIRKEKLPSLRCPVPRDHAPEHPEPDLDERGVVGAPACVLLVDPALVSRSRRGPRRTSSRRAIEPDTAPAIGDSARLPPMRGARNG
jgi:hypothetical protein